MGTYHSHQDRFEVGSRRDPAYPFDTGRDLLPCRKPCCRDRFDFMRNWTWYVDRGWPANGAVDLRRNLHVLDALAELDTHGTITP